MIVKIFPVTHAGVLLRQVFMEEPLKISFNGAPSTAVDGFKEQLGVVLTYGDYTAQASTHILVLIGVTLLFFALAVWNVSRKKS